MKRIALFETHKQLGAKMVDFAGFEMPLYYEKGIQHEHITVRNHVGMFDVSHMGEFIIRGERAGELVNSISSNNIDKLKDGGAQYSCMLNEQGGIIDDLIIYRLDAKTYMLVVNASNIEKDFKWIEKHNNGSELIDISSDTTLLAVQGPKSTELLQHLTDVPLKEIPFYTFVRSVFAGCSNTIISATGYTGSGGFELYFDRKHSQDIWHKIMERRAAYGLVPAGLGARDTLRLEMCYCLYGNDISEETNPFEAGLSWVVDMNKNFVGKEALTQIKEYGITRRLLAFVAKEKGIARKGYNVVNEKGTTVGSVTSGVFSPSLKQSIGMAYVDVTHPKTMPAFVEIRDKKLGIEFVKKPILKK